MKYARLLTVAVIISLLIMALLPMPVNAIADPDTPPSVNAVYVFDLVDGGIGVLISYYLDYAVLPTETATESYLAVFIDTDGATQLKSVAPYTFEDSGYRNGLIWIKFSAAEVATYSIDSADVALYRVWLVGNPTIASGWTGDPPKTVATIDTWYTTGDPEVLLALRVLYYADQLELAWGLDMIQETAVGSRLTATGESYFMNVIPNLRTLAPNVFVDTESSPDYVPISYETTFGATATSGTATIAGSPVTLVSGSNTINTGATTGTIILDLAGWTFGTVTNGTGTVTGSPVTIRPGTNTLTVTGAGTFTVAVAVVDTVSKANDAVIGTAFDLTALAAILGMSRWFLSGIIWMLITIVICVGVFLAESRNGGFEINSGASKIIMLLFTVCILGGVRLGLLHPVVACLLFIGDGALVGYVLFFKSETLHKGFMFMMWMFVIVSIAGNVMGGSVSLVATRLEADVSAGTVSSISVASTEGFPASGIIVIGDECIGYPSKTATTFTRTSVLGVTVNPIERGMRGTTDAAHTEGAMVRTLEASILNSSVDYKVARIVDSAGTIAMLTLPARILDLIVTFFTLPLGFLGTDLAILTYIWAIVAIGMLVGLAIQIIGGRRV